MFEDILGKYKLKNNFTFETFETFESLESKCNAPTDKSGIYLIFKMNYLCETLLYIGSSGQKVNGQLKTRKSGLGGMKDRIVNGYHPKFGKVKRKNSFPQQMKKENIAKLKIYWWVTYDSNNSDFPTDIEDKLIQKYINQYSKKPAWHK